MSSLPPLITEFSKIASDYDVVLSDVWGVIHNGIASYSHACDALTRLRARGGVVVLITNAPRPSESVARQLDRLDVPRETYDAIVSSGDVTRGVIKTRHGQSFYHPGPERDRSIFTGLDVHFASSETADYVVCSGLKDDESETPDDYRPLLESMLARKLFMVCGNPDVVVERGSTFVYCAGAIADLYASMGGEVLYAGSPIHRSMRWRWQRRRSLRATRSRLTACSPSATRCAWTSRAHARWASTSCSSRQEFTPRNSAAAKNSTTPH